MNVLIRFRFTLCKSHCNRYIKCYIFYFVIFTSERILSKKRMKKPVKMLSATKTYADRKRNNGRNTHARAT